MAGLASMAANMRWAAAMPAEAVGQSWLRLRTGCWASNSAAMKPTKVFSVSWPCRICQPA